MTDTSKTEYFIERKNDLYKQMDALEKLAQRKYKGRKKSYNKIMATGIMDLTKGQILIIDLLLEILKSQKTTPE